MGLTVFFSVQVVSTAGVGGSGVVGDNRAGKYSKHRVEAM